MPIKTLIDRSTVEPVAKISGTELVLGSASVGTRYLLIGGAPAVDTNTTLMGGYGSYIHDPEARFSMDVTGTLYAIQNANLGLYGINNDISSSLTTQYDQSVALLEEAKDTNVKFFFVNGPRANGIDGSYDMWGIRHGKGNDPYGPQCQYDMSASVAALHWADAAAFFSQLSMTYPNLIGFTVDDFQARSWICDAGYTRSDVRNIIAGCKRYNPNFEFWPTHYVGQALTTAIPSTAIGFTTGFPTLANEYIGATHKFTMTGETPTSAKLHFLHMDTHSGEAYVGGSTDIMKTLYVNSTPVWDSNILGNLKIEVEELEIASLLVPGENTISMYISSSTATTSIYADRVWQVGDIRVIVDNGAEFTMINDGISSASFDINNGVTLSASAAPRYLDYSGTFVAQGNEDYRYIDELSRTLLFYANHSGSGDGGVKDVLPKVFESYARCCPNTKLIHGQQGFLFSDSVGGGPTGVGDGEIVPWEPVEKWKTGSFISDGSLMWNFPLYMQAPMSGVFSERRGTTATAHGGEFVFGDGMVASCKTTFPNDQLGIRAQFQRFTTTGSYGPGEIYFKIKHEGGLDMYWGTALGVSGTMSGNIDVHGTHGDWHMADDPWYQTSGNAGVTTAELTGAITASTQIVFETNVLDGYGNSYTQVNLSASISTSAGGIRALHRDDFYFESYVTGTNMQTLFDTAKDYYGTAKNYHNKFNNYIIEKRPVDATGPAGWYYRRPADGDVVYVRDRKQFLYYSSTEGTWIVRPEVAYHTPTIGPESRTVSHFTTKISASEGVEKAGFVHAQASAIGTFNWAAGSDRTGSVTFDSFPRMDTDFFSSSGPTSDSIRLRENGTYKISYGINWTQTGSEPPIALLASVKSGSYTLSSASVFDGVGAEDEKKSVSIRGKESKVTEPVRSEPAAQLKVPIALA